MSIGNENQTFRDRNAYCAVTYQENMYFLHFYEYDVFI